MGELLKYRPPKAREENTASIGMVIFLGSWAMMFASLFFAYAFVRARAVAWPPPGLPTLPRLLPAANTAVLALSSLALIRGEFGLRRGSSAQALAGWLGLATALGAGFLVLQWVLWSLLRSQGLQISNGGPYSSVFYGLTALHALHVGVGLVGLASLWWRARAGHFSAARHLPLRLWGMYWHFVGVVWLVMFVSIFLM